VTAIPILRTTRYWYCPNCQVESRTTEVRPHSRFHTCAGLAGLTAPLLERGTKAKVEAIEREDYVGKESVTLDANGRPIMAVVTTRDHGQDTAVFAPVARARLHAE
jgi:hypothetical protein